MNDYKYNNEGKIKREYLSNYLFVEGRYNYMSKWNTKPYPNKNIKYQDLNHLENEIKFYDKEFNKIIMNNNMEDYGKIHINKNNCFCSNCILKDLLNKNYNLNNFDIVIKDNKHFIINNYNKEIKPITNYFKTFFLN